jgi:hypothetical protein
VNGALTLRADDAAKPAAAGEKKEAAKGDAAGDAASVAAVIDKAAEALGGKERLAAVKAATWSSKGTITIGGESAAFTATLTYQGHDRRRLEFETDFAGNPIKAVVVVNGEKAWRKLNGNVDELAGDELANERRTGWREWTPVAVVLLKSPPFKTEPAADADVKGNPAAAVKVTGPAGAPFTLYFDKATGLPVRQTARVTTLTGDEADEEITYADYKDFGGVKKATKVEMKHDGQKFLQSELTNFKVIDSPDAKMFERPE